MEKNDDDYATDDVRPVDGLSPTDENFDAIIDFDEDASEDDGEVIAILEGDNELTPMLEQEEEGMSQLEDGGAIDACDDEAAPASNNGIWEAGYELQLDRPPVSLASAKEIAYEVAIRASHLMMQLKRVYATAARWITVLMPEAMSLSSATTKARDSTGSNKFLTLDSEDEGWPTEDEE